MNTCPPFPWMASTMSSAQYCTTADVELKLSAAGVQLRSDDDPEAVADAIDEASAEIERYLSPRYDLALVTDNRWLKHRAASLAACLLCERRGNPVPVGIARKCERVHEELTAVLKGQLVVPGAGLRRTSAPAMSNVRTVLRPHPRTVVERRRSTHSPEGYTQNSDPYPHRGPSSEYGTS